MNNLIYVASAYAGGVKENSERAKRYCVHVINEGGESNDLQKCHSVYYFGGGYAVP